MTKPPVSPLLTPASSGSFPCLNLRHAQVAVRGGDQQASAGGLPGAGLWVCSAVQHARHRQLALPSLDEVDCPVHLPLRQQRVSLLIGKDPLCAALLHSLVSEGACSKGFGMVNKAACQWQTSVWQKGTERGVVALPVSRRLCVWVPACHLPPPEPPVLCYRCLLAAGMPSRTWPSQS